MMKDVAADPHMAANVIFDILNEPDSYGLTWGPNGKQLAGKGLGYWYHQIMKIGYKINPSALLPQTVFVVGVPAPCLRIGATICIVALSLLYRRFVLVCFKA
jgi:hypothetical protein